MGRFGLWAAGVSTERSMILRSNLPKLREFGGRSARVLDAGGWYRPFNLATHVIDLNPYESRRVDDALDPEDDERFTADTWIVQDVCNSPWPFPDKTFDFVVCSRLVGIQVDDMGGEIEGSIPSARIQDARRPPGPPRLAPLQCPRVEDGGMRRHPRRRLARMQLHGETLQADPAKRHGPLTPLVIPPELALAPWPEPPR